MIKLCVSYGDNVTDGAKMFSAAMDAMRCTTLAPTKEIESVLKDNSDFNTDEVKAVWDKISDLYNKTEVKSSLYNLYRDNDNKQIVFEFGTKCNEPHKDMTIQISIRDDYVEETTEEATNDQQLKLPLDDSSEDTYEPGPEPANDKIEKILDATDSTAENDTPVMAPEGISNGSVDEDGIPEIEISSDSTIEEEGKSIE